MEKQKGEKLKKQREMEDLYNYNIIKKAGTQSIAALKELENLALKNKLSKGL